MSDKDLRSKLIKLAYEHPETREKLLPVIQKAAIARIKDHNVAASRLKRWYREEMCLDLGEAMIGDRALDTSEHHYGFIFIYEDDTILMADAKDPTAFYLFNLRLTDVPIEFVRELKVEDLSEDQRRFFDVGEHGD